MLASKTATRFLFRVSRHAHHAAHFDSLCFAGVAAGLGLVVRPAFLVRSSRAISLLRLRENSKVWRREHFCHEVRDILAAKAKSGKRGWRLQASKSSKVRPVGSTLELP
jgi:hypothetical protein